MSKATSPLDGGATASPWRMITAKSFLMRSEGLPGRGTVTSTRRSSLSEAIAVSMSVRDAPSIPSMRSSPSLSASSCLSARLWNVMPTAGSYTITILGPDGFSGFIRSRIRKSKSGTYSALEMGNMSFVFPCSRNTFDWDETNLSTISRAKGNLSGGFSIMSSICGPTLPEVKTRRRQLKDEPLLAPSFRRKPESSLFTMFWTPAFVGVT